jgi:glycosyltransferase involved in cell wall biosynthesis
MSQTLPRPHVCGVVVLYREAAEQSRTIRSLQKAMQDNPSIASGLFICVYDNSPRPAAIPKELFPCEWVAFQPRRNLGLAEAYNTALHVAQQSGMGWLLLLDSDTEVTASFLKACIETTQAEEANCQLGAVIPYVFDRGHAQSPRWATPLRRAPVDPSVSGVLSQEVVALNSGTAVRVSAVLTLGGFNKNFWLDYLDYWLFRALQSKAYRVYLLPEKLEHSLSFADPTNRMTPERYENMLEAEHYFVRHFGNLWEQIRLRVILLKRALKFGCFDRNLRFVSLTVRELLRPAPKVIKRGNKNVPQLTGKP